MILGQEVLVIKKKERKNERAQHTTKSAKRTAKKA